MPGLAVFVGLVAWQGGWGPHAGAPLLTLFLLWLGKVLPAALDPAQRHLLRLLRLRLPQPAARGRPRRAAYGTYVHAALSLPLMLVLATLSWFVIERPAMRAVRGRAPRQRGRPCRDAAQHRRRAAAPGAAEATHPRADHDCGVLTDLRRWLPPAAPRTATL